MVLCCKLVNIKKRCSDDSVDYFFHFNLGRQKKAVSTAVERARPMS